MNSDLPGGLSPDELGQAGPGLEHLLRALTARATASELAGEQAALAMFRAHAAAPAGAPALGTAAGAPALGAAAGAPALGAAAGAFASLDAHTRPEPAAQPAETRPMYRPRRLRAGSPGPGGRSPRRRGSGRFALPGSLPRLRVAIITGTAMVGGFAAAAYAAVLPAPVQHIAYQAFHYLGVPDGGTTGSSPGAPGGKNGGSPNLPRPLPSVSGANSAPATQPAGAPLPSAGARSLAGAAVLSAEAVSTQVPGGTAATINGVLTIGGKADAGIYVRLMEHVAGRAGWLLVGRAPTNAQGDVSFTTPVLRRDAWFRLTDASGARSTIVAVTVVPTVSAAIRLGPDGIDDYLGVTTTFAADGDVVLVQVLQNGTWVTIKQGELNAKGSVVFSFSATKRQGEELQAVLLATALHGAATSPPATVPPPA